MVLYVHANPQTEQSINLRPSDHFVNYHRVWRPADEVGRDDCHQSLVDLVLLPPGHVHHACIVRPPTVVLHGPVYSDAGHHDHHHGNDEAEEEEVAGVSC